MVIRLSPTMQKRVERAAKTQGMKPTEVVEIALKQYLAPARKPRAEEPVSEARRRLRELARYKKPVLDFDAAVHRAKTSARQSYEDNKVIPAYTPDEFLATLGNTADAQ